MARIGGAFPLPLAQVQEGGTRVDLDSGGVFYPPPGEYVYNLPSNVQLEYFDGQAQSWQILANPSTGGFLSADGYNFRFHNVTGIVNSITISTAGSAQLNGIGSASSVSIAIAASNTNTATNNATGYAIVGGTVAAPTITQAGSGFTKPPLIVIDPPPQGGIQATAYAVVSSTGTISAVTISNAGAGYAASPNFWVIPQPDQYQGGPSGGVAAGAIPPPGLVYPTNALPGNQNTSASGVQLTPVALTGSGTITGLVVIKAGGQYTSAAPAVTVTSTAGSAGTAVGVVTTTSPAQGTVLLQPRVQ